MGWLCLCLDQGTPSPHYVRRVLRQRGRVSVLNLSPWCKPLLRSRGGILGTLGCRQEGGSTTDRVPRSLGGTPTLGLLGFVVTRLGGGGAHRTLAPCPVGESPDSSICSLEVSPCACVVGRVIFPFLAQTEVCEVTKFLRPLIPYHR